VLTRIEDPSLETSLVRNGTWPLLTISVALGLAARDRVTLAVALTTAVTLSAGGVAADQRFDAAGSLLDATWWLIGLTVAALVWSGLGRRSA
jgi:hypothetical protein